MLPRLQADESILASQRTGVGTGSFQKQTAQQILRAWELTSGSARARHVVKKLPPSAMAALGIGVTVVEKPS